MTGSLHSLTTFSPFSPTPIPGNHYFAFARLSLSFLDSTYIWDHTVFVFLCLTSVSSSICFSSVQFTQSCPTLRPHGLQHARPPRPSPTPGVHPDSCPLSRWCHPATSSSAGPFSSRLQSSIRVFSNESALCIRWPKYWSFQLQHQSFQWIFRPDFL